MGPCSTTLRLAPAILIASLSGLASDGHDDNAPDGFGHVITFKPDCLQSHYQVRALTRKPDGTICREIGPIDLTIHRAMPRSVAFGGDNHTIHHDATGHAYDAPHWLDFDRDGQITAPPQSPPGATDIDRRFPIAYTRNTPMTIAAFEPHFSKDAFGGMPQPGDYTIKGTGSDGSVYLLGRQGLTGIGSEPLPDHIAYLPNYSISWEISFDGTYLWYDLGTTTHEVYATLNNPIPSAPIFQTPLLHTTVHIGCTAAEGQSGADLPNVYNNIWQHFATRQIRALGHDEPMTYYRVWTTSTVTARQLVGSQDGQCGAWNLLFIETLLAQGISSQNDYSIIWAEHNNYNRGFFVPNWRFSGPGVSGDPSFPFLIIHSAGWSTAGYPTIWTQIESQPGIPGQGWPEPKSSFANHHVTLVNNKVYDPSYGVTYQDFADFKDNLAGFWKLVHNHPVHEEDLGVDLNGNGNMTDIFTLQVILGAENSPAHGIDATVFTSH